MSYSNQRAAKAFTRRQVIAAAAAFVPSAGVLAQGRYPSKPIKVLLGFPAGGAIDVVFRTIARRAEIELGQPIVIENRPGAASMLSMLQMKNAAPDGYTLGVMTLGMFRVPVMQDIAFDALKDVTFVSRLSHTPFGVVVRADAPFKTFADLVAYGKAEPKKVNYGTSSGLGGGGHLLIEEITGQEGIKWNCIPYKGGPETQQGLLSGELTFATDVSGSFGPFVDAGSTRLLMIATDERVSRWPAVPTGLELGYKVVSDAPWGVGGPKGLDPAIVGALDRAFAKALATPEVVAAMAKVGQGPRYLNHEDYARESVKTAAEERALIIKYGFQKK